MCGIAGIVVKNSLNYKDHIKKMVIALKHRGPDESGIYFFDNCVFGHSRLSIVDLSSGGQPMLSADSALGITFNGEIYGYKEIKISLTDYHFNTTSDTEVILALYKKYGSNMMKKLPGMFAFAIWDDNAKELFCARDRFGEKPFYYAIGKNGEFVFASEIKAILASGLVKPILDKKSLTHYFRHLYVHPYKTIYENIYILPPAHILKFKNNNIIIERYWTIPEANEKIEICEAAEKFRNLLDTSIKKQLIADVPVGAFLSGGLDSSTIVAIASANTDKIKTFSFAFKNSYNELPFARDVARLYNTDHVELYDSQYDIANLLLTMQEVYDEPFADSSNIPTYLISKFSREYVKVVLTGDGGDELFGGYRNWYSPLFFMEHEKKFSALKMAIFRMAAVLASRYKKLARERLLNNYKGLKLKKKFSSIIKAHESQNIYFTESEMASLGFKDLIIEEFKKNWKTSGTIDDAMRMDVENYMPGDILVKIDRASMAHGLELRAPFLDMDFASFCLSLPTSLKITKYEDKLILRKAFGEKWPESVKIRGKQGFGSPVKKWLKQPNIIELKNKYFNNHNQKIFDIISYENSKKFFTKDNYQTWILLNFALWADKHEFEI